MNTVKNVQVSQKEGISRRVEKIYNFQGPHYTVESRVITCIHVIRVDNQKKNESGSRNGNEIITVCVTWAGERFHCSRPEVTLRHTALIVALALSVWAYGILHTENYRTPLPFSNSLKRQTFSKSCVSGKWYLKYCGV